MNRREYLASQLGLTARICAPPAAALTLGGCMSGGERVTVIEGATMGTAYRVTALVESGEIEALRDDAAAIVARVDALMSTYRPDSELSRFNASGTTGWFDVSADTHAVLEAAHRAGRDTGGAFDATVAPLVDLWGFGPAGAARSVPSDARVAAAKRSPATLRASYKKSVVSLVPETTFFIFQRSSCSSSALFEAIKLGFLQNDSNMLRNAQPDVPRSKRDGGFLSACYRGPSVNLTQGR